MHRFMMVFNDGSTPFEFHDHRLDNQELAKQTNRFAKLDSHICESEPCEKSLVT
jgi:hypothetical protein